MVLRRWRCPRPGPQGCSGRGWQAWVCSLAVVAEADLLPLSLPSPRVAGPALWISGEDVGDHHAQRGHMVRWLLQGHRPRAILHELSGHLEVSLLEVSRKPGARLKVMLECKGRFDLAEPILGHPASWLSLYFPGPPHPSYIVVVVVVVVI